MTKLDLVGSDCDTKGSPREVGGEKGGFHLLGLKDDACLSVR